MKKLIAILALSTTSLLASKGDMTIEQAIQTGHHIIATVEQEHGFFVRKDSLAIEIDTKLGKERKDVFCYLQLNDYAKNNSILKKGRVIFFDDFDVYKDSDAQELFLRIKESSSHLINLTLVMANPDFKRNVEDLSLNELAMFCQMNFTAAENTDLVEL